MTKKKKWCLGGAILLVLCGITGFIFPRLQWSLTLKKAFAREEMRLCTLLKEPPYRKRIPLTAEQRQEFRKICDSAKRVYGEDESYQSTGQVEFGPVGPGVMRISIFLSEKNPESKARLRYRARFYETNYSCAELRRIFESAAGSRQPDA